MTFVDVKPPSRSLFLLPAYKPIQCMLPLQHLMKLQMHVTILCNLPQNAENIPRCLLQISHPHLNFPISPYQSVTYMASDHKSLVAFAVSND